MSEKLTCSIEQNTECVEWMSNDVFITLNSFRPYIRINEYKINWKNETRIEYYDEESDSFKFLTAWIHHNPWISYNLWEKDWKNVPETAWDAYNAWDFIRYVDSINWWKLLRENSFDERIFVILDEIEAEFSAIEENWLWDSVEIIDDSILFWERSYKRLVGMKDLSSDNERITLLLERADNIIDYYYFNRFIENTIFNWTISWIINYLDLLESDININIDFDTINYLVLYVNFLYESEQSRNIDNQILKDLIIRLGKLSERAEPKIYI